MTDTRELLAMMTAHGVPSSAGVGGIPALTAQDVAAAMGMGHIPRREALLLLVKFCDDRSHFHELWAFWFKAVMEHAISKGWRTNRRPGEKRPLPRFKWLAEHTLQEALSDLHCQVCEGHREIAFGGGVTKECPACRGTGRRYWSQRQWAYRLRVGRGAYRRIWSHRVAWCRHEIQVWELNAIWHASRFLYSDA